MVRIVKEMLAVFSLFTEDNSTLDYSEYLTFSHPEKCRINQRNRYNDSTCNNTDESRNKLNGNIKISALEEINQHDSEKMAGLSRIT